MDRYGHVNGVRPKPCSYPKYLRTADPKTPDSIRVLRPAEKTLNDWKGAVQRAERELLSCKR